MHLASDLASSPMAIPHPCACCNSTAVEPGRYQPEQCRFGNDDDGDAQHRTNALSSSTATITMTPSAFVPLPPPFRAATATSVPQPQSAAQRPLPVPTGALCKLLMSVGRLCGKLYILFPHTILPAKTFFTPRPEKGDFSIILIKFMRFFLHFSFFHPPLF